MKERKKAAAPRGKSRAAAAAGTSRAYGRMTRSGLLKAAKTKGFKGISRYTKDELLRLLETGLPAPGKPAARPAKRVKKVVPPALPAAAAAPVEQPQAQVRETETVFVDWGTPLPERYGVDTVGALAKDPNWLFVYWDLSGSRMREIIQSCGRDILNGARWLLRVCDLSGAGTFDIPIKPDALNWYIPVHEDRTFKVQIGLLAADGRFIEFACSREVRTPRGKPSANVSEEWFVADTDFRKFLEHIGLSLAGSVSSAQLASLVRLKMPWQQ